MNQYFASSSSVYGIKNEANVTENSTLEPLTDYSKYKADCEEILLGDVNLDDFVNVLDVVTLVQYIIGGSELEEDSLYAADINQADAINVLDVVNLVNFVLNVTNPTTIQFLASDMNGDGTLNVLDVVLIVNTILGD